MIHGVWADGTRTHGSWNGLKAYLLASSYQDCNECVVDYGSIDKAPTFDPFAAKPSVAITALTRTRLKALDKLRRQGIAATQVDVVAHSMGGLVTRARVAQESYRSWDNYHKGEFHKIITVGTPHLGSPAADWMIANRCTAQSSASREKNFQMRVPTLWRTYSI